VRLAGLAGQSQLAARRRQAQADAVFISVETGEIGVVYLAGDLAAGRFDFGDFGAEVGEYRPAVGDGVRGQRLARERYRVTGRRSRPTGCRRSSG
jgi:hypothetical protein